MAKALNIANGFHQGAYQLLNPCQFGENQGLAVPLILDMIGCRFWICLGQYLIGRALSVDKIIPPLEPNFETSAVFIGTPCIAPSGSTYISFLSNQICVLEILLYVAGA